MPGDSPPQTPGDSIADIGCRSLVASGPDFVSPSHVDKPVQNDSGPYVAPKAYVPPLSFPQRRNIDLLEKKFGKFLDMLKNLHVNIPFIEAMKEMPAYTKFLKEILSNKRKIDECQSVSLTSECCVLI